VPVVAPALNTRARYWLSDPDSAVGRADDVQQETVERMDEQGGDAVGDTRRIRSPPLSQPLWWCLEWASDESEVLALSTSEEEPVGNGRRQAGDPREFPSVHSK